MKIEIKIKKNEFDEYEVRWIENGKRNEAKTYYIDDKEDADLTKIAMEKEAAAEINRGMIKQQAADHLAFCQNQE